MLLLLGGEGDNAAAIGLIMLVIMGGECDNTAAIGWRA